MGKCGACVDTTLTVIGNNKLVTFLGVALFALVISTISLAAVSSNYNNEIGGLRTEVEALKLEIVELSKNTVPTQAPTTSMPGPETTVQTTVTVPTTVVPPKTTLRLDETIIPEHYDLLIHPDLKPGNDSGKFFGTVTIKLNILAPVQEIILHSSLLNISTVSFTAPDKSVAVQNYQLVPPLEILKVLLNKVIDEGNEYYLEINFSGWMTGKIVGLYRSSYKDADGNDRILPQLITHLSKCCGDYR